MFRLHVRLFPVAIVCSAIVAAVPFAQAQAALPDGAGAFATGKYRNLFAEDGHSAKEIQARIDAAYAQLFHGDPRTQAIAFAAGAEKHAIELK